MILGIGNDIVDIRRIEKLLDTAAERFILRTFSPQEQQTAQSRQNGGLSAATYAKRFAAKEACAKALGTAIRGGITFLDFEVSNTDSGQPVMHITGKAKEHLDTMTPAEMSAHIHLSLSDDYPYAQAYVIIEAR